jgi:uncharacterized protein (TIGR02996 family)
VSAKSELLAAIYADPDSDDARIVFADLLLDDDDPRGEMIAKQLAGEDAAAEPLLAKHGVAWLGSLRAITAGAQFRRGFPARVELTEIRRAGPPTLDRITGDRALGTIEDLQAGRCDPTIYARLITSPAMTALRRVEVEHRDVLAAVRDSPAPIDHVFHAVHRSDMTGAPPDRESFAELLELCERRPAITTLAFDAILLDQLIASRVCRQLHAIEIFKPWSTHPAPKLARYWRELPGSLRVTLCRRAGDLVGTSPSGGALELALHDGQLVGRAWGDWRRGELLRYVDALPKELSRLELAVEPDDELRQTAARRELELHVVPAKRRYGFVRNVDY